MSNENFKNMTYKGISQFLTYNIIGEIEKKSTKTFQQQTKNEDQERKFLEESVNEVRSIVEGSSKHAVIESFRKSLESSGGINRE
jgi:predicted dinucleotide-utilizing enzyme